MPSLLLRCKGSLLWPIFLIVGAALVLISGLAVYAWLIYKHPTSLTGVVATLCIVFDHTQTLSVFARLHLAWPPRVEQVRPPNARATNRHV